VDTEQLVKLGGTFVVSGDRIYDMALRLQYSREALDDSENPFKLILEENLEKAIQIALKESPIDETLHIIPTYSAMLEVRGLLTGQKIL
jgi:UDP-N-acetylmuramyl tripeptide synthase